MNFNKYDTMYDFILDQNYFIPQTEIYRLIFV